VLATGAGSGQDADGQQYADEAAEPEPELELGGGEHDRLPI
jgi:hypothetical protein